MLIFLFVPVAVVAITSAREYINKRLLEKQKNYPTLPDSYFRFPKLDLSDELKNTYGITSNVEQSNYFDLALARFENSLSQLDQQTLNNHKAFLVAATQSVNAFAPATASRHLFMGAREVGGEEVAQISVAHLLNVFQRYTQLITALNSEIDHTFRILQSESEENQLRFCEHNQILLVAAHQHRNMYDPVNACTDYLARLAKNPKELQDQLKQTRDNESNLKQVISMVNNGVSYSIHEIQHFVEHNAIYDPMYQPILNMYTNEKMQDYIETLRQLTDNELTRPFVHGIFQALNIIFPKVGERK